MTNKRDAMAPNDRDCYWRDATVMAAPKRLREPFSLFERTLWNATGFVTAMGVVEIARMLWWS